MLAKKQRLNLGKQENRQIFNNPIFSGELVKAYGIAGGSEFRAAVIVSKKKIKSAAARNLIKRRFFSAIKNWLQNNDIKGKIIFLATDEVKKASFSQIEKETKQALRHLK